jgi:hypothetical protein
VNQVKIYNSSWNSKEKGATTKSKKRMSLFKEKNKIRPPYFQISHLRHSLFVLNNFKAMKAPFEAL